jgi:hypothetical protein
MLFYPQLATGALAQYPLVKERLERTIQNIAQDGSVISLYDIYAPQVRWILDYESITDAEADTITSFFQSCEGSLQPFLFVDPSANLLLFNGDLTQSCWVFSSLLQITAGIADPMGGAAAIQVVNSSQTSLPVTQSVSIPGQYTCAFSVYLRSSSGPCTVMLSRSDGNNTASQSVSPSLAWTRFYISSTFASSQSTLGEFSLEVPAESTVDVFGLQVDAQPHPGTYLPTTSANATYPSARFDMNQVTVVSTGPSQNNLRVNILSPASS